MQTDEVIHQARAIVAQLQARLHERADPSYAEWYRHNVKPTAPVRGVRMQDLRHLVMAWHQEWPNNPNIVINPNFQHPSIQGHNTLVTLQLEVTFMLFHAEHVDDRLAAMVFLDEVLIPSGAVTPDLLPRLSTLFPPGLIADFKACDHFAAKVLQPLLIRYGSNVSDHLRHWFGAESVWQARAALSALTPLASDAIHDDLLFSGCNIVLQRPEEEAKSIVGSALRALGKVRPQLVDSFLSNSNNLINTNAACLNKATQFLDARRQTHFREQRRLLLAWNSQMAASSSVTQTPLQTAIPHQTQPQPQPQSQSHPLSQHHVQQQHQLQQQQLQQATPVHLAPESVPPSTQIPIPSVPSTLLGQEPIQQQRQQQYYPQQEHQQHLHPQQQQEHIRQQLPPQLQTQIEQQQQQQRQQPLQYQPGHDNIGLSSQVEGHVQPTTAAPSFTAEIPGPAQIFAPRTDDNSAQLMIESTSQARVASSMPELGTSSYGLHETTDPASLGPSLMTTAPHPPQQQQQQIQQQPVLGDDGRTDPLSGVALGRITRTDSGTKRRLRRSRSRSAGPGTFSPILQSGGVAVLQERYQEGTGVEEERESVVTGPPRDHVSAPSAVGDFSGDNSQRIAIPSTQSRPSGDSAGGPLNPSETRVALSGEDSGRESRKEAEEQEEEEENTSNKRSGGAGPSGAGPGADDDKNGSSGILGIQAQ